MKNKNKGKLNNYKWLQYSAVGMITGASIGVGAFYIANAIKTEDAPSYHYGVAKSQKVFDKVNLVMHETNPGAKEEDKTFFLSQQGLDEFVQMIKDRLDFGPEFFDLNKISIDDKNLISEDANGNYYPKYDTINLSSEQFRTEGLPALKKGDTETLNARHTKVELLFQVFFHEYGHFMANKYLEGYSKSGKVSGWNKNFEDGFEKLLHYSDKNTKPMLSKVPGQKWQSMGSIYSAADIYGKVNFENNSDPKFPEAKSKDWFPIWGGVHPFFSTADKDAVAVDTSKIKYLWSLEELFTRKYQQVLMTPQNIGSKDSYTADVTQNYLSNGFHYFRNNGKESNNITPYAYDTSMYKDFRWLDTGSKMIGGSSISIDGYLKAGLSINDGDQYMADDPLLVKTEMKNLLKPHYGINKEVSVMFLDKDNKLHIGGFTNAKKIEIKIGNKVFGASTHATKYWSSDSIWDSEAIDADSYLHQKIEIIIDGKAHDLTDVRTGETGGTVSTHRTLIKHSDYHLSYNTNKSGTTVTIEKGAGI